MANRFVCEPARLRKNAASCSVDGCDEVVLAKGFCSKHYRRFSVYGDPLAGRSYAPRRAFKLPKCAVEGCDGRDKNQGYCNRHYLRLMRHGDPLGGGRFYGEIAEWVAAHLNYAGDDCLIWPFYRLKTGYGWLRGSAGKSVQAHREMLIRSAGPPPDEKMQAAHNCGNGHLGCVNPRHLEWKTQTENQADRIIHGTSNRGERSASGKLTEGQVREIVRLLDGGASCTALGRQFGVRRESIRDIRDGKTWFWLTGKEKTR